MAGYETSRQIDATDCTFAWRGNRFGHIQQFRRQWRTGPVPAAATYQDRHIRRGIHRYSLRAGCRHEVIPKTEWSIDMRIVIAVLAATIGAALAAPGAEAAPASPPRDAAIQNIILVAEGCGRGWHWVGGHRRRDGVWVPGHCVRNY